MLHGAHRIVAGMTDEFETAAREALSTAGMTMRDGDLDILRLISGAFDSAMQALDEVDLADLPLEPDLDPSRAPR
jgi:hypothetical protein